MRNEKFIGNKIIELDSVDSTNNFLSKLVSETNVENGTVILAHNQTKGKGQRGNSWFSEGDNNLTTSIFLKYNELKIEDNFYISMFVSLSIQQLLAKKINCDNVKIKWPNDILVNNKKITGILIENTLVNSCIKNSIIGVGINLNQSNFPEELNATSVLLESEYFCDIPIFLKELCNVLNENYYLINQKTTLKKKYLSNLFGFSVEREYLIVANNKTIIGEIIDVKTNGFLIIKTKKKVYSFDMKEIVFVL